MGKYAIGLKKLEIGTFSLLDGTVTDLAELEVNNNTMIVSFPMPTKTEYRRAGSADPVKIGLVSQAKSVKFKVLDTASVTIAKLIDGDVTTANSVDTFGFSKATPTGKVKALVATTLDGQKITVPKGFWVAGYDGTLNEDGIALIDVDVTPMDTGFTNVKNVQVTDAA